MLNHAGGTLSTNHNSLHDEDTHHDLQTLGLVSAVQALPPGLDLTLVHQADNKDNKRSILIFASIVCSSIPLCYVTPTL